MSGKFGLELIHEIYRKDFSLKSDALIALLHWKLLTRDLRCVGKGDHFGGDEVSKVLNLIFRISVILLELLHRVQSFFIILVDCQSLNAVLH